VSTLAPFKALVRDTCAQTLALSGLTSPAARLRHRLSIITFHRVLTSEQRRLYPLPGLAVTPEELDAHLRFATRHFQCLPLASAVALWRSGRMGERPLLAVTFDDGQLDNHNNALPVLERHGVKASFFIPTQVLDDPSPLWHDAMAGLVARLSADTPSSGHTLPCAEADALLAELNGGPARERLSAHTAIEAALEGSKLWRPAQRKDWIQRAQALLPPARRHDWDGFMSVDQLKHLIARGHEIGSHSHSHPLLPQCTADELHAEIAGSRQRLENALDAPVSSFCYPNGSHDAASVEQVRLAGYGAAVTTRWGSNERSQDPYRLLRFDMNARHAQDRQGRFSEARLAWRMSGWHPGLGGRHQDAYSGSSV